MYRKELMKHLPIRNLHYHELIISFRNYLYEKGYSKGSQSMMPSNVQEFLHRMEQKCIFNIRWIEPKHIKDHYSYLGQRPNQRHEGRISSSMLNHHVYSIRLFFEWLLQLEAIPINPISGLEFPRPDKNPREALTIDELGELFQKTESLRERAVLGIYYGCGLRRTEGQNLNACDIDFHRMVLIVRKGKFGKRREIPMHTTVANDLMDYWTKERQSYVIASTLDNMQAFLLNSSGHRMSGAAANRMLKVIAERTNIKKKICLHVLRHSIATHLKQNGMPIEQVQEILGHSSIDMTQNYMTAYRCEREYQHA